MVTEILLVDVDTSNLQDLPCGFQHEFNHDNLLAVLFEIVR
jgi:hypothetical protein